LVTKSRFRIAHTGSATELRNQERKIYEMNIQEILTQCKKIAVIGYSDNLMRDSNRIAHYMSDYGYEVTGVNPKLIGQKFENIQCYDSLLNIPGELDLVNVFRRSDAVLNIVKDVLKLQYKPVIWTQFGVINKAAKDLALENGLTYVENKCIYLEHKSLKGLI